VWKSFSSGRIDSFTLFVFLESGHFITTGIRQVAAIPFTEIAQLCNAAEMCQTNPNQPALEIRLNGSSLPKRDIGEPRLNF
jgi:hypothetical protein